MPKPIYPKPSSNALPVPNVSTMKTEKIYLHNLKCSGCAGNVTRSLEKLEGVSKVDVDLENNLVTADCDEAVERALLSSELKKMGYPELEDDNNLGSKIKSYSSCLIGKIENNFN